MAEHQSFSRVLIVGAGPTGLTAAVELARRGMIADVIEKQEAASNLSRAVGIRDEAVPYQAAVFHDEGSVLARLDLTELPEPDLRLCGLAQDRTETHLRTAFESMGGRVAYSTELTELGGAVYFAALGPWGRELWRSNGKTPGHRTPRARARLQRPYAARAMVHRRRRVPRLADAGRVSCLSSRRRPGRHRRAAGEDPLPPGLQHRRC